MRRNSRRETEINKKEQQKVRRCIGTGMGWLEQVQKLQNKILISVSENKEKASILTLVLRSSHGERGE